MRTIKATRSISLDKTVELELLDEAAEVANRDGIYCIAETEDVKDAYDVDYADIPEILEIMEEIATKILKYKKNLSYNDKYQWKRVLNGCKNWVVTDETFA